MQRIIIPVPCHFAASDRLCETTLVRLRRSLELAKPGDIFLLSGDVPNIPGGPTLGKLMRDWLYQNGIAEASLYVLKGGIGTFSESRAACRTASHLDAHKLLVISSTWYLLAGATIWRRRAAEHQMSIVFESVGGTGGWRTLLLYLTIATVVHAGTTLGLERWVEQFFTSAQKNRTQGFTLNGCA